MRLQIRDVGIAMQFFGACWCVIDKYAIVRCNDELLYIRVTAKCVLRVVQC